MSRHRYPGSIVRGTNPTPTGKPMAPMVDNNLKFWEKFVNIVKEIPNGRDYEYYSSVFKSNSALLSLLKELPKSDGLQSAVDELRKEKCVFGLVLVAMTKEDVRYNALKALASFAKDSDITSCTNGFHSALGRYVEFDKRRTMMDHPYLLKVDGLEILMTPIHVLPPEYLMRFALEEDSPLIANIAFLSCLTTLGKEKTRPLFDLLVRHNYWNYAIENEISRYDFSDKTKRSLPDEWAIELGAHIDSIAKSRAIEILVRIAEIHPDNEVRVNAINAIKDTPYENIPYYLAEVAAKSRFEDTGKYAIDVLIPLVVARTQKSRSHRINDACICPIIISAIPEVAEYAFQKLLQVWDKCPGYNYPNQWNGFSAGISKKLVGYFCSNLNRLIANSENSALSWLLGKLNERGERVQSAQIVAHFVKSIGRLTSALELTAIMDYYKRIGNDSEAKRIGARLLAVQKAPVSHVTGSSEDRS